MNPLGLMTLNMQMVSMVCEAQTVIALRVMGMSGVLPARPDENSRMLAEKPTAMIDAYAAGLGAAMAGKSAEQVTRAAMKPLQSTVRANRRRLMK